MTEAELIATTPEAPWLPPDSTAEVWAGKDCRVPEPVIIVRLLVTRSGANGHPEFFCVPTAKGADLPTQFLGAGPEREDPSDGLGRLVEEVLGREISSRCIGYVRNVVPNPDDTYAHPTPWAHVPVFEAVGARHLPIAAGEWVTMDRGRNELPSRHWWPIVEHHLT